MFNERARKLLDFGKATGEPEELNLIPLINVVFLLLIFFLFTSTLTTPDSFEVTLPESETGEAQVSETVVVLIGVGGQLALNNRIVEASALTEEIAALLGAGTSRTLMIKADATATTAEVLAVLRYARAAGAERIALATQASDT